MTIKQISPFLSVSPQLTVEDVARAAGMGFHAVINNRPEGETDDQPPLADLEKAAAEHGLDFVSIPVAPGNITDADIAAFRQAMQSLRGPVLAYCRTGTRAISLWALSQAPRLDVNVILDTARAAEYDIDGLRERLEAEAMKAGAPASRTDSSRHELVYDVVIVGGGTAGIATAASLLHRRAELDIAIIEPRERHFYQPGYTLAGAGVFHRSQLSCKTADVIPEEVHWIHAAASDFDPNRNEVILEDGSRVGYRQLVVAPGIKLDWEQVEGLSDTLGENGVTSNYRFDLTSYTWKLVQELQSGRAIFTQPPMPIKCAGAPQKAMYLSCDHWLRHDRLKDIEVDFCNAGGVLFGVKQYVPALMEYVRKYDANLKFFHNLVAVDGPARKAWFDVVEEGRETQRVELDFDMLHVCPPQVAPDFIRRSVLADDAGWVEVEQDTLRHKRFHNIFGLGDACSAPNAKTMAAARKQAPVVAENVLASLDQRDLRAIYTGYGSCPLTVERGRVVLAEFGYGGELQPSFPRWLLKGEEPSRLAWFLKERALPPVYYKLMLRGREWLAEPEHDDKSRGVLSHNN